MKDEKKAESSTVTVDKPRRSFFRRPLFFILILCLVPLLALGGWLFFVEYIEFNFHPIIPGVAYRCAQPSPSFLKSVVEQNHIQSIIKLNRTAESSWSNEEPAEAKKLGVKMIYIPVGVAQLPTRGEMIQIVRAVDRAPRPVLIHCKTGADRTGLLAVLVAWRNGESYEQAKSDQLRLAYLHVGHWGDDIDDVLSQYEQDMAAEHKTIGSYDQFRQYVIDEYYPSFYHARIDPVEDTLSGHPGQTVVFTVKLTNLSPRLWDAGFLSSLYLNLGIPGTGIEDFPDLLAKVNIGKTLAPGASETVRLPVTIPDVPAGIHRYILDIQVHRAMTFSYYGSPTANVYLDVQR